MTGKIATFAAALALLVLLGAADVASATATESAGSRADLVAKLTPNGRQVLSTLAVGAVAPSGLRGVRSVTARKLLGATFGRCPGNLWYYPGKGCRRCSFC